MRIAEDQIVRLILERKEKQVFEHLYQELFPTVKNYIRKNNGITDDAYDVFQDALMYFYNQVINKTFDVKYTVYGYVFRLSVNRWLNKLNKDKRMVFQTELSDDIAKDFTFANLGEDRNEKENFNVLTRFVSYLGEKCEEVLSLRIYSNLMFEDIALRLGLSTEASAKMSFKRCREKLIQLIKDHPELEQYLRQNATR
jgi:RNA polymerase sigma factor (sigma-70 family)